MSTLKGTVFVSMVAIVPPVVAFLDHAFGRQQLTTSPKLLVLLLLGLYSFAVWKITVPFFTSPLRKLPCPPGATFFAGHATLASIDSPTDRCDVFRQWLDEIPNDGLIHFRGPLHTFPSVCLTTVEGLQEVLVSKCYDFEKYVVDRMILSYILGHGLIATEGAEHKFQRKCITPAFAGSQINALVPLFWSKSQELVNVIADQLNVPVAIETPDYGGSSQKRTGVIELGQWASRVTLDIIGMACVGRDFDSIHNSGDEIAHLYEQLLKIENGTSPLLLFAGFLLPSFLARWSPIKRIRESAESMKRLRILCRQLMKAKRRDMDVQSEKHVDILSVLIRTGQFSDDGLVDQLLTFLAAGHETTSNAFTWTMWLLAAHPQVQEKLRTELRNHCNNHDINDFTNSSLDQLPYLHAVTSEQLRLYPVVPYEGRIAACDTTILGQFIPRGTMVHFSPWAFNRSKDNWGPDAQKFNPERWLANGQERLGGGKSALSLLTFLHGPRSCIGQAFSRAELKCLVAAFVMKFEAVMADPNEKVEAAGLITIRPKNGLNLRLKEL